MNIAKKVHGVPVPQPRARAVAFAGRARVYNHAPKADAWKAEIKKSFDGATPRPLSGAVSICVEFWMPRPKSHYNKSGNLKPSAAAEPIDRNDLDNMAKAVMDALTAAKVWHDDGQVTHATLSKMWAEKPEDAGAWISVTGDMEEAD